MKKVIKRLALMLGLTFLAGIVVGFPVGQTTGPSQIDQEVVEGEEIVEVEEIAEEDTNPGVIPKEMVPHHSGSVVKSIEGPWQIRVEGLPSGNVVFSTFGPRDGSGEGIPEGYKAKVVDFGPQGLNWCYELDDWAMISDARRLTNGNYLFFADFGIYEVTPEGREVAFVRVPGATHHTEKLPNGNYLVVAAIEDRVYEITRDEEIVWSWSADEDFRHLRVREEYSQHLGDIYTSREGMPPSWAVAHDWVHVNYAQRLENGNTIVSLRNLDLVLEITPSKEIVRTFGALFLKYQHTPVYYPESNSLLIFDNFHDRVVEVDWGTQEVIWEYTGLHSRIQGSCQKLKNGNILICDSCQGRIIEVTPDKQIVWELTVPGMQIYRAFGY